MGTFITNDWPSGMREVVAHVPAAEAERQTGRGRPSTGMAREVSTATGHHRAVGAVVVDLAAVLPPERLAAVASPTPASAARADRRARCRRGDRRCRWSSRPAICRPARSAGRSRARSRCGRESASPASAAAAAARGRCRGADADRVKTSTPAVGGDAERDRLLRVGEHELFLAAAVAAAAIEPRASVRGSTRSRCVRPSADQVGAMSSCGSVGQAHGLPPREVHDPDVARADDLVQLLEGECSAPCGRYREIAILARPGQPWSPRRADRRSAARDRPGAYRGRRAGASAGRRREVGVVGAVVEIRRHALGDQRRPRPTTASGPRRTAARTACPGARRGCGLRAPARSSRSASSARSSRPVEPRPRGWCAAACRSARAE